MKTLLVLLLLIPSLSWGDSHSNKLKHKILACNSLSSDNFLPKQIFYFKTDETVFHLILPIGFDYDVLVTENDYFVTQFYIYIRDPFGGISDEINRNELKLKDNRNGNISECKVLFGLVFTDEIEFENHFQEYYDKLNEDFFNSQTKI